MQFLRSDSALSRLPIALCLVTTDLFLLNFQDLLIQRFEILPERLRFLLSSVDVISTGCPIDIDPMEEKTMNDLRIEGFAASEQTYRIKEIENVLSFFFNDVTFQCLGCSGSDFLVFWQRKWIIDFIAKSAVKFALKLLFWNQIATTAAEAATTAAIFPTACHVISDPPFLLLAVDLAYRYRFASARNVRTTSPNSARSRFARDSAVRLRSSLYVWCRGSFPGSLRSSTARRISAAFGRKLTTARKALVLSAQLFNRLEQNGWKKSIVCSCAFMGSPSENHLNSPACVTGTIIGSAPQGRNGSDHAHPTTIHVPPPSGLHPGDFLTAPQRFSAPRIAPTSSGIQAPSCRLA